MNGKASNRILSLALAVTMVLGMVAVGVPPMNLTVSAAGEDYTLNSTPGEWTDSSTITLDNNGDVLTITATNGPSTPVKIDVTATSGEVTVKGKDGAIYQNLSISVGNADLTLNLEDLNLKAVTVAQAAPGHGIHYTGEAGKTLTINVEGNCSLKGGDGLAAGSVAGDGIHSTEGGNGCGNITINGSGELTVRGGNGVSVDGNQWGQPGSGIYMSYWSSSASILTINAKTTAFSGDTDLYGEFTGGTYGAICTLGSLYVNAPLTAIGGDNNRSGQGYGRYGIYVWYEAVIKADVFAQGGRGHRGGQGVYFASTGSLTIENATLTAIGGDGFNATGGAGLYLAGNKTYVIAGAGTVVEATGGESAINGGGTGNGAADEGGEGIHLYTNSNILIKDGAVVYATGGDAMQTGSGGRGVYGFGGTYGSDMTVSNATLIAKGGDGKINGGHAMMSYFGEITIEDGANVTATGGNGETGVGGVGMRALGLVSPTYHGKTITIANDAGDVYIRGGVGNGAQRASLMGGNIYIATGNVGAIAHESGTVSPEETNIPGGDNIYMLTVDTNPTAATTVTSTITTSVGSLSPEYTYSAPTLADGVAYMWLPAGDQTVSASGYADAAKEVTADNLAAVTLMASYSITVLNDGNGTGSASPNPAAENDLVTLTANPHQGYHFKEWQSSDVTITGDTFTMPPNAVTVTAIFEADTVPTWSITVIDDGNGTGSASPNPAAENDQVTLTANPNQGYHFKEWQSSNVTITGNTFTMPANAVTVTAVFETDVPPPPVTDDPYAVGPNPMNFDLNGQKTGTITISLGQSSGSKMADRADIYIDDGNIADLSDTSVDADADVTVTAKAVGTAVLTVTFYDQNGDPMPKYGGPFTVDVSDSTPSPMLTPTPSRDSDSDSSNTREITGPAIPSTLVVDATKAKAALSEREKSGAKKARIRHNGEIKILAEAWPVFGNVTVDFDTLDDGAVQVRVTVREPGKMTGDKLLSGYVKGNVVDSRKALFEKWFKNKVRVIHFDQQGSFGQPVEVAAKLDLTGMDTANLYFYCYDSKTNTYKRIEKPAYWIDKNGYLHFTTEYAGDIIISEGPLEKK